VRINLKTPKTNGVPILKEHSGQCDTIDLAEEEKITYLVFLTILNHRRNQIT
jgi:hypothetical protein